MNLDDLEKNAAKCGIPSYMHGGITRYFRARLPPGGFLTAVLTNDLKGAALAADSENCRLLWDYVNFLYNYTPASSWGSKENVKAWLEGKA